MGFMDNSGVGMTNMPFNMMQAQSNAMQASFNTRPQDSTFSDMFQRSGRMVQQQPRPVPNEEGVDPLFLPVDSNIFKEDANRRNNDNHNNRDPSGDEESEKSFEEAIDNIYTVDHPSKRS